MASNGFPREAVVDNLKFNGTEYPGFVSSTVARKSFGANGNGGLLFPSERDGLPLDRLCGLE